MAALAGESKTPCVSLQDDLANYTEQDLLKQLLDKIDSVDTTTFIHEFIQGNHASPEWVDQQIAYFARSTALDPQKVEKKFPIWFSGFYMEQPRQSESQVPEMREVASMLDGYLLNDTWLYKVEPAEYERAYCHNIKETPFSVPDKLWIKIYNRPQGVGEYGVIFTIISAAFTRRGLIRAKKNNITDFFYLWQKPRMSQLTKTYFYEAELKHLLTYKKELEVAGVTTRLVWLFLHPGRSKPAFQFAPIGIECVRYSAPVLKTAASMYISDLFLQDPSISPNMRTASQQIKGEPLELKGKMRF